MIELLNSVTAIDMVRHCMKVNIDDKHQNITIAKSIIHLPHASYIPVIYVQDFILYHFVITIFRNDFAMILLSIVVYL